LAGHFCQDLASLLRAVGSPVVNVEFPPVRFVTISSAPSSIAGDDVVVVVVVVVDSLFRAAGAVLDATTPVTTKLIENI
jgi:hypothetical protein